MQKKLMEGILLLIVIAACAFYLVKNPDHKFMFIVFLAYLGVRFKKTKK